MVSRVKSLLLEKSNRGLHNNEIQWTESCLAHNSALHPPPSPFPLNPTYQRPPLFVYKHNILRPAPFKNGPRRTAHRSEPQEPGRRAMASMTHTSRRAESVRRSLFGPVDHEQLRRELRQRLKEMSEQDSRRWNFDFQTDTPLAGRFQWEEVPLDCAAALYQESAERGTPTTVCPTSPETQDRLSASDQENCSSISNTRLRSAEETPARRKRARSRSVDKSGKCARITGEQRVPSTCCSEICTDLWLEKLSYDSQTNCLILFVQIFSRRGGGRRKQSACRIPSTKAAQKQLCAKQ